MNNSVRFMPVLSVLLVASCAASTAQVRVESPDGRSHVLSGRASWYGPGFEGKKTASGELFRRKKLTAAHRTLPFGTQVEVKDVATGKKVTVRVNDRGPFTKGRVIDLSEQAASDLGIKRRGVAPVTLRVLSWP